MTGTDITLAAAVVWLCLVTAALIYAAVKFTDSNFWRGVRFTLLVMLAAYVSGLAFGKIFAAFQ